VRESRRDWKRTFVPFQVSRAPLTKQHGMDKGMGFYYETDFWENPEIIVTGLVN
jgi:hypothetical protein